MLNVECSMLNGLRVAWTRPFIQHSTFNIEHSTFRLQMHYPFEKHFLVCIGGRCGNPDRGIERGEFIHAELKGHNKKMGRKPLVRVCTVSCLDLCDHGPNMIVDG